MNRRGFFGTLAAVGAGLLFWRKTDAHPAHWVEDELSQNTDVLTRSALESYTIIEPEHPHWFRAGDIIHFPRTGENCRVIGGDQINNCLHVERGLGSKPWDLNAGEPVWILDGAGETSYEAEAAQQAYYESWKAAKS